MNHDETVDLLSLISARDNRTVGHTTVLAWLEDIGDLVFADCREAVGRHFRESTEWLMPANVRRLVKSIRAERLEGFQYVPVAGDEHTAVYLANFRAQRAAVADGHRPAAPPALPASEPRAEAVRELVAGVFPEPPATDEPPARHAAETTAETRRRKAVEAYGYLLTIDSDASRTAMDHARSHLAGPDADTDEIVILAATLTNATPLPAAKPDKATADLLAAQGCPNGCPLGTHVKPCHYTDVA